MAWMTLEKPTASFSSSCWSTSGVKVNFKRMMPPFLQDPDNSERPTKKNLTILNYYQ